jgi:hypothetical protein
MVASVGCAGSVCRMLLARCGCVGQRSRLPVSKVCIAIARLPMRKQDCRSNRMVPPPPTAPAARPVRGQSARSASRRQTGRLVHACVCSMRPARPASGGLESSQSRTAAASGSAMAPGMQIDIHGPRGPQLLAAGRGAGKARNTRKPSPGNRPASRRRSVPGRVNTGRRRDPIAGPEVAPLDQIPAFARGRGPGRTPLLAYGFVVGVAIAVHVQLASVPAADGRQELPRAQGSQPGATARARGRRAGRTRRASRRRPRPQAADVVAEEDRDRAGGPVQARGAAASSRG